MPPRTPGTRCANTNSRWGHRPESRSSCASPRHCLCRKRSSRARLVASSIHNAREHNLQNVDVDIPRNQFTVITGVSGTGKSTLAFDILFAEGQRRYLESLNAYARQFVQPASRPDVDAIFGIPPTVAIEQRTSRGGRKSTVATLTEIYHFLRLLYVKLGTQYCPDCDVAIEPQSFDAIAARMHARLPRPAHRPARAAGHQPQGLLHRSRQVGARARATISCASTASSCRRRNGRAWTASASTRSSCRWPTCASRRRTKRHLRAALERALDFGKGIVHVLGGLDRLAEAAGKSKGARVELALPQAIFSTKRACPSCARSFPELDPRLFSFNSKHGWCESASAPA